MAESEPTHSVYTNERLIGAGRPVSRVVTSAGPMVNSEHTAVIVKPHQDPALVKRRGIWSPHTSLR